jgi:hypothetical protein
MKSRSILFPAVAALTAWTLPAVSQPAPDKEETAVAPDAETSSAETAMSDDQAATVATATVAEVRAGSRVFDIAGGEVGTVESVDENGAVVSTGSARARLPFTSFGKNDHGLVISMSKAQLEAAVAARTPS